MHKNSFFVHKLIDLCNKIFLFACKPIAIGDIMPTRKNRGQSSAKTQIFPESCNKEAVCSFIMLYIYKKESFMIEYIKGELTELTPALATVEAAGVGYGLNISLNTYSAIQGKKEVRLWVFEAIREDAHVLYGFADKKEREMFTQLISVSGVGSNTARMMLSSMTVNELCNAISTGNERAIKAIKGIGKMTAQRVIVDLRDKIVTFGIVNEIPAGGTMEAPVNNQVKDEAVSALTMLGFSPAPTQKIVLAILKEQPNLPVEQVVKLALKQIK